MKGVREDGVFFLCLCFTVHVEMYYSRCLYPKKNDMSDMFLCGCVSVLPVWTRGLWKRLRARERGATAKSASSPLPFPPPQ